VKAKSKRNDEIDFDLSSRAAFERFRKAAKAYAKRVNRSPETALQALVAEGIYTKSGKLTKNYR